MARFRVSTAERRYITGGAELGVRADGRGRLDRREFSVQTGVIAQVRGLRRRRRRAHARHAQRHRPRANAPERTACASGSPTGERVCTRPLGRHQHPGRDQGRDRRALARPPEAGRPLLHRGLVRARAHTGSFTAPMRAHTEPQRSRVAPGVAQHSAAIASQSFEGRGADDVNADLGQVLQKVLSQPGAFDLDALGIYPGVQCWNLYLDALVRPRAVRAAVASPGAATRSRAPLSRGLWRRAVQVLDFGGNLVDALLLASRAALADLRFGGEAGAPPRHGAPRAAAHSARPVRWTCR